MTKERETQCKAEENRRRNAVIDDLTKYVTIFKNGTINTTPDNGSNDESDKDMSGVGDEDNNGKRPSSNYAYKPANGSAVREYLESVVAQVKKKDDPLKLRKGVAWIPPPLNPILQSLGPEANPNRFYVEKLGYMCGVP